MNPDLLVPLAAGTVFPWQGGILDQIAVGTFGIIVTIVLGVIVLLDSELTWLDDELREERRAIRRRNRQLKRVHRRQSRARSSPPGSKTQDSSKA